MYKVKVIVENLPNILFQTFKNKMLHKQIKMNC